MQCWRFEHRIDVEGNVAVGAWHAIGHCGRKVKEIAIHQMRRCDARERRKNIFYPTWKALFPVAQHQLGLAPLEIFLRPAKRARNDRKRAPRGIGAEVGFLDIGKRTDHHMAAVVRDQPGRHAL